MIIKQSTYRKMLEKNPNLCRREHRRRRRRTSANCFSSRKTLMTCVVIQFLLVSLSIFTTTTVQSVAAKKQPPSTTVKNLHVTFRGQTYTIPHSVRTAGDLTKRFEEVSGIKLQDDDDDDDGDGDGYGDDDHDKNPLEKAGIIWKGRVLTLDQSLSEVGIQNGDKVLIFPVAKKTGRGLDALAMFVVMASDAWDRTMTRLRDEKPEAFESLQERWDTLTGDFFHGQILNRFDRKTVADELRNSFDRTYHRIRSCWEHPAFRRSLHDPEKIESYRKVISANLSPRLLHTSPAKLQTVLSSPDVWRNEFIKATSILLKLGDTILAAVLDLLLDVLKGKSSYSTTSDSPMPSVTSTTATTATTAAMDDPSIANDLLFELSESEGEDSTIEFEDENE
mmetsp:Transcript_23623/g.55920  ORF Transcript_23623/g.55920 Transcript_23623/m.55920 type:complete len:393 (-) Transcript_23623:36-1214(-)